MKKNKQMGKRVLACLVAVGMFSTTVFGATTSNTISEKMEPMTYEKAVELVTKNNTTLTDLAEKIDYLGDNKSDMLSDLGNNGEVPGASGGLVIMDSARLSRLGAVNSITTNLEISDLDKELTKQGIAVSVKSSLADIKLGQENCSIMEDTLAQEKQSLAYARVKASLGMTSADDLKKLEATTLQTEQSKKQLGFNLEKEYIAFNNLLGLSSDKRYDIDYEVEVTPVVLDTKNLDDHIDRALGQDLSLKIAKVQMDSEGFSYLVMSDSSTVADYRNAEYGLAKSERAYADAKKNKKNAMRSAYIQLQGMEASQKSLEADLTKAQTDYKQAQINYQIGNIAKINLDQAQIGLKKAKMNVEKNQYDYDTLKYTFEHPSLVGGASGGSQQS